MPKNLRPQSFSDYMGQDRIKQTLQVVINSARKRRQQLDHVLLFGKTGIGKTTLALVIANEYGRSIKFAQGPNLEKKADVLALVGSIQTGDVVFIDEIHGINRGVQETLYSTLDEGVIDIIIGPEGASKIMRLKIPHFTLIGATTQPHELSLPFKNRFGIILKLKNYDLHEMELIIKNLVAKMGETIDPKALQLIAKSSRHNPRQATNILKRVVDFTIDAKMKKITMAITMKTLQLIGIYQNGLEDIHLEYLKILSEIFYEKWASLENISSLMQEAKGNVESLVEPALIELQYIEKSSRGRKITNEGIKYLTTYNLLNV